MREDGVCLKSPSSNFKPQLPSLLAFSDVSVWNKEQLGHVESLRLASQKSINRDNFSFDLYLYIINSSKTS